MKGRDQLILKVLQITQCPRLNESESGVAQSCLTLCKSMDSSPPGSFVGVGKNTGVDCNARLQRFFPSQRLDLGLLHCRQILCHLSHKGRQD